MKKLREITIRIEPDYQLGRNLCYRAYVLFNDGSKAQSDEFLNEPDDRAGIADFLIDKICRELKAFLKHEHELENEPRLGLLEFAQELDRAYALRKEPK